MSDIYFYYNRDQTILNCSSIVSLVTRFRQCQYIFLVCHSLDRSYIHPNTGNDFHSNFCRIYTCYQNVCHVQNKFHGILYLNNFYIQKLSFKKILHKLRGMTSISAHDQKRYPLDHSSACLSNRNVQLLQVKSDGNLT